MMVTLLPELSPELQLGAWRFSAACAGSLALALLLAALLPRAARRWTALAAHRGVWLLAQACVLAVFLLACTPLPRAAVAPVVSLPALVDDAVADDLEIDAAAATPAPSKAAAAPRAADAPSLVERARGFLPWLPAAWLFIYAAGLAWHAARRILAARRWRTMLLRHSRLEHPETLDAALQPARIASAGLRVRSTDLPVSPLLHGLLRPCLVLPSHLASLSAAQQAMIVEHELTHWRRRDPAWLAVTSLTGLLFWFNRPYQTLAEGLREAVELGCDDAVLSGRVQRERLAYAAALVAQLKLAHGTLGHGACPAPAFGQLGVQGRVLRMREARPPRLSSLGRWMAGAAALGLCAAAASVMPAFLPPAVAKPLAPQLAQSVLPEPVAPRAWAYPLERARVTSLYGVRSPRREHAHHGLDFAARRGTPVAAVAAGTVIEASQDPAYGKYVRVDHGAGQQSLMAHLDSMLVRTGQRIEAGQAVGTTGATGKASGPHLHLEYWQDGRRRNPERLLADLTTHATPHALAQYKAQSTAKGGPIPDDE
jgi:beta-lactamase regulating signal transducer with metallopeptidase domain